jgi:hypothetical protein
VRDDIAVDLEHLQGIGRVSAPSPGPISTKRSRGCGAMAATMAAIATSSVRKFCPKRLRGM